MSERTPLLENGGSENASNDIYDRFSSSQKLYITIIVSVIGLLGLFASGCFTPTILEIARDLNTTGTVINYTIGAYIFVIAIGCLIWAPYAGYYGRRPVYLCSLPLVTVGSLVAASAPDVLTLVVGRSIQGLGTSCAHSVGAATISDIYKLEERGTGMGIFFGFMLLGPPLAPLTGGILATYASWRIMQLLLGLFGLLLLALVFCFLPETIHPGTKGMGSGSVGKSHSVTVTPDSDWKWVWLNSFTPFSLAKGRVVLLVAISSSLLLGSFYLLMIPVAYTLAPAYGLTTPAQIGACFLANGFGNMIGAAVSGHLADKAIIAGRARRRGKWYPEDRLIVTIPGGLVLFPAALICSGLTITYVPGRIGLIINLVCLFLAGFGLDTILAPSFTYLVDLFRYRGAEAMAFSSALRYTFGGLASAAALPLINSIGLVYTNLIAAMLGWCAFILLFITIKYGNELRASYDVGYASQ